MKKISPFNAILIVLVALFIGYKLTAKNKKIELPKYGAYLSCQGHPFDYTIKFQSSLWLAEKAMPEAQEDKDFLYWAAAFVHNRFLFTNLTNIYPNSEVKSVTLNYGAPKINVLNVEKLPYPASMEFEPDHKVIGYPHIAEAYIKKLLGLKKIEKDEAGVKVTYEYEAGVLACLSVNDPGLLSKMKIYQPVDPYMAYFVVHPSQRKLISGPLAKGPLRVNPCMNPDAVDHGANPFTYWHHWRPLAQGRDSELSPFDCTLHYTEGKTIQAVNIAFTENAPKSVRPINYAAFENLQRPIKATIIFGATKNHDFPPFDSGVEALIEKYTSKIDLKEAREEMADAKKYDPSLQKVLLVLWNLSQQLSQHSRPAVKVDPGTLEVTVRGKMQLSKKDIEIKLLMLPNEAGSESYKFFNQYFAKDLKSRDIVIYEGHANTGATFDYELMKNTEGESDPSLAYQILGVFSCSAQYYFDATQFPRSPNPGFKRDVIHTANTFADTGLGALGLIASLDGYLYNEAYVPFAFWAKTFKSDNFFVLTNH